MQPTHGRVHHRMGAALHQPTRRTCGNAPCPRPPVGRPNAARLAGVSGTSRVVPSNATSRHHRYHAPFVLRVASGRATSTNSARSGVGPSRALARAIELLSGTCQLPCQAAASSRTAAAISWVRSALEGLTRRWPG
jgi:hypothetical protein